MSITLDKITIKNAKNKDESINVSGWTKPFVDYMLAYAFDVRMQRCTAGIDKELPTAEKNAKKLEARLDMEKAQKEGKMPEKGGGGGGPRQSPEDKGWIGYFKANGHKESGKPVNGETLDRAQDYYVRQVFFEIYLPGTDERKAFQSNMKTHVKKHRAQIIEAAESDLTIGTPGHFIKLEQDRIAASNVAAIAVPKGFSIPKS